MHEAMVEKGIAAAPADIRAPFVFYPHANTILYQNAIISL